MREGWGEVSDLLELRQGLGLENVSCLVSDGRKGKNAYSKSLPGAGFGVTRNQQFCMLSFFHSYLFFGIDSVCHGTKCHMEIWLLYSFPVELLMMENVLHLWCPVLGTRAS